MPGAAEPGTIFAMDPPAPPRWWQAPGPWRTSLEGPTDAPWHPAWLALLAGGEVTMPLDDDAAGAGGAPSPGDWRPPWRRP